MSNLLYEKPSAEEMEIDITPYKIAYMNIINERMGKEMKEVLNGPPIIIKKDSLWGKMRRKIQQYKEIRLYKKYAEFEDAEAAYEVAQYIAKKEAEKLKNKRKGDF